MWWWEDGEVYVEWFYFFSEIRGKVILWKRERRVGVENLNREDNNEIVIMKNGSVNWLGKCSRIFS